MATLAQIDANRQNAKQSGGPTTAAGKAIASANSLQHGLRSSRMFVNGEDPAEFGALCADIDQALRPLGAIENALAERIAINLWRQRRLVRAETAIIDLERRDARIAREIGRLNEPSLGGQITTDTLQEFPSEQAAWCSRVIEEITNLQEISFASIEKLAPLVVQRLAADAEENEEPPEEHAKSHANGLTGYVSNLLDWCQAQLRAAEARPRILEFAEQLRERDLVLPANQLEVLSRYQTTLDNQFYKALRAFRDAQEWRLKTLDGEAHPESMATKEY